MKFRKKSGIGQNQEKSGKSGSAWWTAELALRHNIESHNKTYLHWFLMLFVEPQTKLLPTA